MHKMKAMEKNDSRTRNGTFEWAPLLLLVAFVMVTYSDVLTSRYGFLDDYGFLQNGIAGSDTTFNLLVSAGRPINAWLLDVGFAAAGSIEGLAVLRLVTLLGISLLGCTFYLFSRRHGLSQAASASIAVGVALLPSFQVYAAWAQHFTTPFAGVLSVTAAYLLSPVRSTGARVDPRAFTLATLLLAAAVLTYQPTAMLFCTAFLLALLSSPQPLRHWNGRALLTMATSFGLASIFGYIALKIGQGFFAKQSARYGLLSDPLEKLNWFLREPLLNAASLYSVPGDTTLAATVAVAILAGFAFYGVRKGPKSVAFILLLWAVCLFGSYLPNLATGENWASYRSIAALAASIVVTVAVLVIDPIAAYLAGSGAAGRRRLAPFGAAAGVVVVVSLSILSQRNLSNTIILPNVSELDNLSAHLAKHTENAHISRIIVRPSTWTDFSVPIIVYDEFGFQSSYRPDFARAIVDIVRKSRNIFLDADVTVVANRDVPIPPDPAALVVDFSQLVSSPKFRTIHDPANTRREIVLADITDHNWTNGIWTNREHPAHLSFVFRRTENSLMLRQGDRVKLGRAGERTVVKVDRYHEYVNVLVDGPALEPTEGYPAAVTVVRSTGP